MNSGSDTHVISVNTKQGLFFRLVRILFRGDYPLLSYTSSVWRDLRLTSELQFKFKPPYFQTIESTTADHSLVKRDELENILFLLFVCNSSHKILISSLLTTNLEGLWNVIICTMYFECHWPGSHVYKYLTYMLVFQLQASEHFVWWKWSRKKVGTRSSSPHLW